MKVTRPPLFQADDPLVSVQLANRFPPLPRTESSIPIYTLGLPMRGLR
jgi:hypothetical protein